MDRQNTIYTNGRVTDRLKSAGCTHKQIRAVVAWVSGYKQREIAEYMSIDRSSVSKLISRARTKVDTYNEAKSLVDHALRYRV